MHDSLVHESSTSCYSGRTYDTGPLSIETFMCKSVTVITLQERLANLGSESKPKT